MTLNRAGGSSPSPIAKLKIKYLKYYKHVQQFKIKKKNIILYKKLDMCLEKILIAIKYILLVYKII